MITLEQILARTTEEGDCLLWNGYEARNPQIHVPELGKRVPVRRLVMQLMGREMAAAWGSICGNSLCINPRHIVAMTKEQHISMMNMAMARGPGMRLRIARMTATKRRKFGKLTLEKVQQILASKSTCSAEAEKHGVSPSLISAIRTGKRWQSSGLWAQLSWSE